jgi:hypothetical protein
MALAIDIRVVMFATGVLVAAVVTWLMRGERRRQRLAWVTAVR